MAESWVCGDCRSLNHGKAVRCYRCLVPRKTSEMTAASAAVMHAPVQEARTLLAQVERMGARYHATWPLAFLLILIIAVATVTSVLFQQSVANLFDADGQYIDDPILFDEGIRMFAISTGSFVLGIAVWSLWLALVVRNVPALVARWPKYGWVATLLMNIFEPTWTWNPFSSFQRPFAAVREVCSQLSDRPNGAILIAAAWWLCVLIWYFGSNIVVIARVLGGNDPTFLQSELVGVRFGLVFFVPAGIFAAGVVFSVERLQRQALRRRATTLLMPDGSRTV
jgi:hypothetical protein